MSAAPNPKGASLSLAHSPDTTPVDRLALALRLMEQLSERLVRIETRLVILMRNHGLDANGNPID